MSYYSKTLPNLVQEQMEQNVLENIGVNINKNTFSEDVSRYIVLFYTNYLRRYFLALVLVICIVLYLLYRYYDNKDKKKHRAHILAIKRERQLRNIDRILNRVDKRFMQNSPIPTPEPIVSPEYKHKADDAHINFDAGYYNYSNLNNNK